MNDQDVIKRDTLEAKLQRMERELSKTNKEKGHPGSHLSVTASAS
jgi:hypothetical protein